MLKHKSHRSLRILMRTGPFQGNPYTQILLPAIWSDVTGWKHSTKLGRLYPLVRGTKRSGGGWRLSGRGTGSRYTRSGDMVSRACERGSTHRLSCGLVFWSGNGGVPWWCRVGVGRVYCFGGCGWRYLNGTGPMLCRPHAQT